MSDSSSSSSSGIGFGGLLLVAFIVLKLCKVIDWSWWWVLSPMWLVFVVAFVGFILYATIANLMDWRDRKKYLRKNRLEPL